MIWSSWSEFFAMGGYGIYVWGSYFVTFVCVIGEGILISRRRRTFIKRQGLIHVMEEDISSTDHETTVLDDEKKSDT